MRTEIAEIPAIAAQLEVITEKAEGSCRVRFAAELPAEERERDLLRRYPDEARAAIRDERLEREWRQDAQRDQGQDREAD